MTADNFPFRCIPPQVFVYSLIPKTLGTLFEHTLEADLGQLLHPSMNM